MNNYTKTIGSILRYNVIIRDCLEYVTKKDSYDTKFYEFKKHVIHDELVQQTPLKVCLDNSNENGEKLKKQIGELEEALFSDGSTIIKVRPEGIDVDHVQHLAVFDAVLPVREEINKIVMAHVIGAKKANMYEANYLDKLVKADEFTYRGFALIVLLDELDHLFAEYNKARQEAKGAITPQSNFIQNDITKVVGHINMIRQLSTLTSADYYEVIDPLFALVEMTSGRRDLPAGKGFGQVFTDVKTVLRSHVQKWEADFKTVYEPFMKEFIEEAKKANAQSGNNANEHNA